ncbi:MAG: 4'-phosphopantetheinyl transferase superfamily protein, partial [Marinirhabdus sp.]
MPIYKTISLQNQATAYIWKIDEPLAWLSKGMALTANSSNRLSRMKSELHRRGFMSVRHLLARAGYTDFDLYYDANGKPHLRDAKHISITHSYTYSALIVGPEKVGIDIELQRKKILKIAQKFTPLHEYRTLANDAAVIRKLTMVWCAKECLYKSFATPGVSFLEHIYVNDFLMETCKTTATVSFKGTTGKYDVSFLEFENFTCAHS